MTETDVLAQAQKRYEHDSCLCGARKLRTATRCRTCWVESRQEPDEARFWARVNKTEGCWLWTGGTGHRGYGRFYRDGKMTQAHHFLYGPIPEGMVLDHLCRTPNCVRPDHLEAVTSQTNILRGVGPTADNARQTHCRHGHPLAGANLYVAKTGNRACKECGAIRARDRRARRRAEALA